METFDFAGLMEEPPGGENFGRAASTDPHTDEQHVGLSADDAQSREFVLDGGWNVVTHAGGEWKRSGGSDHRGVLRGDEYIDANALMFAVERELGFTIEEVDSVYRQGRMSGSQRELRGRIDARLLALSRSGASMLELARIFGWTIKSGGKGDSCDTMERAVARARAIEAVPA